MTSPFFTMVDQSVPREALGIMPEMFDTKDPRPAKLQANDRYRHGGGWSPLPGWSLDRQSFTITYDEERPLKPLAVAHLPLTREILVFYAHSWLAVIQKDRSFEVSRMD